MAPQYYSIVAVTVAHLNPRLSNTRDAVSANSVCTAQATAKSLTGKRVTTRSAKC